MYSSPLVMLVKHGRHVAHMQDMRNPYEFLVRISEGKRSVTRPDIDERLILKHPKNSP